MARSPYPKQSDLPGQDEAYIAPFFPGGVIGDVTPPPPPEDTRIGSTPGDAFVVSTFSDAKPLNAIEAINATIVPEDPLLDQLYLIAKEFVVPQGRSILIREWSLDIAFNTPIDTPAALQLSDIWGQSLWSGTLTFLLDGVSQPGMTDIPIAEAIFGTLTGDCYIVANDGQTFQARIKTPHTLTLIGRAAMELNSSLFIPLSGVPTFEPANQAPLPVTPKT